MVSNVIRLPEPEKVLRLNEMREEGNDIKKILEKSEKLKKELKDFLPKGEYKKSKIEEEVIAYYVLENEYVKICFLEGYFISIYIGDYIKSKNVKVHFEEEVGEKVCKVLDFGGETSRGFDKKLQEKNKLKAYVLSYLFFEEYGFEKKELLELYKLISKISIQEIDYIEELEDIEEINPVKEFKVSISFRKKDKEKTERILKQRILLAENDKIFFFDIHMPEKVIGLWCKDMDLKARIISIK